MSQCECWSRGGFHPSVNLSGCGDAGPMLSPCAAPYPQSMAASACQLVAISLFPLLAPWQVFRWLIFLADFFGELFPLFEKVAEFQKCLLRVGSFVLKLPFYVRDRDVNHEQSIFNALVFVSSSARYTMFISVSFPASRRSYAKSSMSAHGIRKKSLRVESILSVFNKAKFVLTAIAPRSVLEFDTVNEIVRNLICWFSGICLGYHNARLAGVRVDQHLSN